MPASGSSTSPVPVSTSDTSLSATIIMASSRPEVTVGPPVLGELDRRPHELAAILLELRFKPLEQRKRIGRRAGKAADDLSAAKLPHLAGVGLDDGLADRDLAVAADGDEPALADGQDRGAVPGAR